MRGSISIKTGRAPSSEIGSVVATNVWVVVMTSSPAPTPSAMSARCSAAVPESSPIACLHLTKCGEMFFKLFCFGSQNDGVGQSYRESPINFGFDGFVLGM